MRRLTATLLLLAILIVFGLAVATVIKRKGGEDTETAGPGATTSTSLTPTTRPSATTAPSFPTSTPTTATPSSRPAQPTTTGAGPTTTVAGATTTPAPTTVATTTTIAGHPNTGGGSALVPGLALLGLGAAGLAAARRYGLRG